jgi:hypothetical protein
MQISPLWFVSGAVFVQMGLYLSRSAELAFGPTPPAGLFFLAGLALALIAPLWRRLGPRHVLVLVPILFAAEWALYLAFGELRLGGLALQRETARDAIWSNLLTQGFFSALVGAGLWMRARYSPFEVRLAGRERSEQETLYDIKQRFGDEENFSYMKYFNLGAIGITLIGSYQNEIAYVLHCVRRPGFLFLYDFLQTPEAAKRAGPAGYTARVMFRGALRRPELRAPNEEIVFLATAAETTELGALLESLGFVMAPAADADFALAVRHALASILPAEFEGWRPFQKVQRFYRLTPSTSGAPPNQ